MCLLRRRVSAFYEMHPRLFWAVVYGVFLLAWASVVVLVCCFSLLMEGGF
jgi:hypothetical protein